MIPLASSGSGGNHMIVIDVTVTSETVIFCGGPEGADAQEKKFLITPTMDFNYTYRHALYQWF